MNKTISLFLVFTIIVFLASQSLVLSTYANVSLLEAKQMIDTNPGLVILDVRTLEEYESGHIENAILIPVTELEWRIDELDKEKETLVYCKFGSRSATASETLVDNGFSSVYNMLGGITAWRDEGYWIEIIHEGDLVITGTQTHVIENCSYVQSGNIYVRDEATLKIHMAELVLNQTQREEFRITFEDSARIEMFKANLSSRYFSFFRLFQRSSANIGSSIIGGTHVQFEPWFFDESTGYMFNSTLSFQTYGNSVVEAHECESRWSGGNLVAGSSHVSLYNTDNWLVGLRDEAKLSIYDSIIRRYIQLEFDDSRAVLRNMNPGFYEYWNIHQNQSVQGVNFNLTLVDTELMYGWSLYCWSGNISVHDSSLRPFYCHQTYGNLQVWLYDTSVRGAYFLGNSVVSIFNSTLTYHIHCKTFSGLLGFHNVSIDTFHPGHFEIDGSQFYMYGNMSFEDEVNVVWVDSNVTRNFSVVVMNQTGNPVEDSKLNLYDENDTIIWNGTTDFQGKANFNLTFRDYNYANILRLEAVKGNFTVAANVTFLSDTPVILGKKLPEDVSGDLNRDGIVDIFDVVTVSIAFGSRPGDSNWDPTADVSRDGVIDIFDVVTVTMNFGKTA